MYRLTHLISFPFKWLQAATTAKIKTQTAFDKAKKKTDNLGQNDRRGLSEPLADVWMSQAQWNDNSMEARVAGLSLETIDSAQVEECPICGCHSAVQLTTQEEVDAENVSRRSHFDKKQSQKKKKANGPVSKKARTRNVDEVGHLWVCLASQTLCDLKQRSGLGCPECAISGPQLVLDQSHGNRSTCLCKLCSATCGRVFQHSALFGLATATNYHRTLEKSRETGVQPAWMAAAQRFAPFVTDESISDEQLRRMAILQAKAQPMAPADQHRLRQLGFGQMKNTATFHNGEVPISGGGGRRQGTDALRRMHRNNLSSDASVQPRPSGWDFVASSSASSAQPSAGKAKEPGVASASPEDDIDCGTTDGIPNHLLDAENYCPSCNNLWDDGCDCYSTGDFVEPPAYDGKEQRISIGSSDSGMGPSRPSTSTPSADLKDSSPEVEIVESVIQTTTDETALLEGFLKEVKTELKTNRKDEEGTTGPQRLQMYKLFSDVVDKLVQQARGIDQPVDRKRNIRDGLRAARLGATDLYDRCRRIQHLLGSESAIEDIVKRPAEESEEW